MSTLLDFLNNGNGIEVFSYAEKLEVLDACDNIGLRWTDGARASSFIPPGDHMYFVVEDGDLYWGSPTGAMANLFRLTEWKAIRSGNTPVPYVFSY